jgi:hypothetical protein
MTCTDTASAHHGHAHVTKTKRSVCIAHEALESGKHRLVWMHHPHWAH